MRTFLAALGLVLATALGVAWASDTIDIKRNTSLGGTGGTKLSASACNAVAYTGWINQDGVAALTFDITSVDANDSVTAATMNCWTSNSASTANGSGFEVPVAVSTSAAGVTTYAKPHTWSQDTDAADSWSWTVATNADNYINCAFLCTGTPAAADTLTVSVVGSTP